MAEYKVCPICGKKFWCETEYWVYRKEYRYYCTWTCFQKSRKKSTPAYNYKQYEIDGEVHTMDEWMKKLGLTRSTIQKWVQKGKARVV